MLFVYHKPNSIPQAVRNSLMLFVNWVSYIIINPIPYKEITIIRWQFNVLIIINILFCFCLLFRSQFCFCLEFITSTDETLLSSLWVWRRGILQWTSHLQCTWSSQRGIQRKPPPILTGYYSYARRLCTQRGWDGRCRYCSENIDDKRTNPFRILLVLLFTVIFDYNKMPSFFF